MVPQGLIMVSLQLFYMESKVQPHIFWKGKKKWRERKRTSRDVGIFGLWWRWKAPLEKAELFQWETDVLHVPKHIQSVFNYTRIRAVMRNKTGLLGCFFFFFLPLSSLVFFPFCPRWIGSVSPDDIWDCFLKQCWSSNTPSLTLIFSFLSLTFFRQLNAGPTLQPEEFIRLSEKGLFCTFSACWKFHW